MSRGNALSKEEGSLPDLRPFLREVLKAIWMDNTPEEVIALWKARVAGGGDFPSKALKCLQQVIEHPPPDLVELLQEKGWVFLVHQHGGEELPFTFNEHVEWLRHQASMLRQIFVTIKGKTTQKSKR